MGKRTMWLLGAGATVMLAGYSFAAMGCSNATPEQRPPVTELKEGINLLDVHDAAWGVNAAFVKAGRVVYLETRVGTLKPDIYRQSWPDDPKNENDMRFVDQHGKTFYAVRGGDNFVDPTWAEQIVAQRGEPQPTTNTERELDFQLAKEAAHAFAASAPPGFADHVHPMALFAKQLMPSEDPVMIAKAAQIAATPRPEAAYGNAYLSGSRWLETDKYSGSTGCFAWICVARHSATNMWSYTTGWSVAVVANNHGRAPSQLGYDCYSNGGWFSNVTVSGSTAASNTGNNDGQGGCQTQYAWDSGGYDHECNDDAAYELWQAKSGGMNTSQGGNISFKWYNGNYFACQCNSFNGCTGDWKSPTCP